MQQHTDEELIRLSRESGLSRPSDPFLEELLLRHRRKVTLWCLRYAENREEALDLAQDVLTTVVRRIDSFHGDSRFTTWLYTVCRNLCLNAVKARSVRPQAESEEVFAYLAAPSAGAPEDLLARKAQLELARTWIRETLDETERRVFLMHYVDEVPLDSITRLLGLSNASGAKAFIVSARRKLGEAARRWRSRNGK